MGVLVVGLLEGWLNVLLQVQYLVLLRVYQLIRRSNKLIFWDFDFMFFNDLVIQSNILIDLGKKIRIWVEYKLRLDLSRLFLPLVSFRV